MNLFGINISFRNIYAYIIRYLHTQLFVTTISLPIFLWWGIPVSALSLVGNLIFAPVLLCYLLLCWILFLCTLAQIPSMALIRIIDWFGYTWHKILEWWPWEMYHGFACPPLWIMLSFSACALWTLRPSIIQNPKKCIAIYCATLCFMSWYSWCIVRAGSSLYPIDARKKYSGMMWCHQGAIIVVAGRWLTATHNIAAYAEYQLGQALQKQFGTRTIDMLVVGQTPSVRCYEHVLDLCATLTIHSIAISTPYHWQDEIVKNTYEKLCAFIREHNITLIDLRRNNYIQFGAQQIYATPNGTRYTVAVASSRT